MEPSVFESPHTGQEATGLKLLHAFQYWRKKLLWFNIIIGCSGLIVVLAAGIMQLSFSDCFGILLWAFIVNACYTAGYVAESIVIATTRGQRSLAAVRDFLFWAGTIMTAFVTCSLAYFSFRVFGD